MQQAEQYLVKQELKQGDQAAILAKKDISTLALLWAMFRKGIAACLLKPDLTTDMLLLNPIDTLQSEEELAHRTCSLNSPATMLFTSGTTSQPKIAVHSFGNHYFSALGLITHIPFTWKDRWLLSLPLHHVSGLSIIFRAFITGATIVLPSDDLFEDLLRFSITHLSLVPVHLYRWQQQLPEKNLKQITRRLKVILAGGDSVPKNLHAFFQEMHFPLYLSYGMTEMSATITLSPPGSYYSSGFLLPFRNLMISSEKEILVKGKTLFLGYWDKISGLNATKNEKGWFHTRDKGDLHPTLGLSVLGRFDRQFISGGENIQPEEIEEAIRAFPGVEHARVTPKEDEEFGKRPVAFIKVKDPSAFQKQQLLEFLKQRLPKFKIPYIDIKC